MTKRNSVPIQYQGIGTRISALAKEIGDRKTAASIAEVSVDTLQRWIREDIHPNFISLALMADEAGYSLNWVSTGQGAKKKGDYETEEDEQRVAELSARPYGKGATHTVNDIGKALRSSREKYELALEILDCKPSDKTEQFVKTLVFSIEQNRTMSIENIIALIEALEPN